MKVDKAVRSQTTRTIAAKKQTAFFFILTIRIVIYM